MRYTPVELRHVKPSRAVRGYKRAEVDQLLEDVAESFEDVWRERGELADKLEDVEKRLEEVKQRESLLASTLVAAEKTAVEQIESAKREAEVIVAEAHQESRSITRTAQAERERLFAEARRVEVLLRAALGMVEESRQELAAPAAPAASSAAPPVSPSAPEPPAAAPARETWPNRQDTREFQAVKPASAEPPQLPPVQEIHEDRGYDDGGDGGVWAGRDFAWG